MIVHLGGTLSHGTTALHATCNGEKTIFGIQTKIKVEKNQINGIEREGKIASGPHGFLNPDKKTPYVAEHKQFLLDKLNVLSGEIEIVESEPDIDTIRDMYVGD
jgi:hypothetical protein